jgi:hypothetical protein
MKIQHPQRFIEIGQNSCSSFESKSENSDRNYDGYSLNGIIISEVEGRGTIIF